MRALSSSSRERIFQYIDELFDNMSLQLLGETPYLKGKKSILFSSKPDLTLAHLFLRNLNETNITPQEEEAMKSLTSKAEEYVHGLRSRTKAQMISKIETYLSEKASKGKPSSTVDLGKEIGEVLESAKSHFNKIAEYETTHAANLGGAFQIARVGASQGQSDPNCYLAVIHDGKLCEDCKRLHLLDDEITPRIWKLSDISFGYGKKTDQKPTIVRHNHCRCRLVFLANGFSFENGQVSFQALGHDEYEAQKGRS